MNKQFKWRHISDSILDQQTKKIFVKGKKNKVFVTTKEQFFHNVENKFDFYWLPLYEKDYLFKNLHQAFFNFETAFIYNKERNFNHNDKYCFNLN